MSPPADPLALADWRRRVAEMYASVRQASTADPLNAWLTFRSCRDDLFKTHAQSPLDAQQQATFTGLLYFDYDPAFRLIGSVNPAVPAETSHVRLETDGEFRYTRIAQVCFVLRGAEHTLSLYWIEGYGGGLFLPFGDASNGRATYGAGRYLYDTIKGADLGAATDHLILDFNFAYNPSCAYNPRWVCPLAPYENRLPVPIEAGEMAFV